MCQYNCIDFSYFRIQYDQNLSTLTYLLSSSDVRLVFGKVLLKAQIRAALWKIWILLSIYKLHFIFSVKIFLLLESR